MKYLPTISLTKNLKFDLFANKCTLFHHWSDYGEDGDAKGDTRWTEEMQTKWSPHHQSFILINLFNQVINIFSQMTTANFFPRNKFRKS